MENKIEMPRLGVNDDFVLLAEWTVDNGSMVEKGQTIACIETTKEASEIVTPWAGFIKITEIAGQDIQVGKTIAIITERLTEEVDTTQMQEGSQVRMTKKARIIAEKYGINLKDLPTDRLIKERDILPLIKLPYSIENSRANKILIYGGGGFGKIAADILRLQHIYEVLGFIDSNYPEKKEILSIPVIGNDDNLEQLLHDGYTKIFNAVGFLNKGHWRKAPYEKLKSFGFEFINVIHQSSIIEQSVQIGVGNLICAGAIIGSETQIGNNCIINAGSIISHDCIISDSCHIASGAVLAGMVIVGENTLIGQNCTIYSNVKIGKNVVIQNGCHIFKDVGDGEVVFMNT
ncbi:MAG: hypothetical protein HFH57_09375 [Lachnospiraceae bacterium]|nr:hypothetical protein [Lachnospiraceae bacterium]